MRTRMSLLVVVASVLALPGAAGAATFTVNSGLEGTDAAPGNGVCQTAGGVCTIRAAIVEANALPGADAISLPAGGFQLTSALPIASTLTLTGAGTRATNIAGKSGVRVLAVANSGTVRIADLSLTGGAGGLDVQNGDVTLDRVSVRGGIYQGAGNVEGGGIQVFSGALTLLRSTVSGNLVRSTGGQALGGGISMGINTQLLAVHSTIAGNEASATDVSGQSFGGGLMLRSGAGARLRHVTLAGNSTTAGSGTLGGNIYREASGATSVITDSIVADGTAAQGANCRGVLLPATGRNLDTDGSCFSGPPHLSNVPANLGALGDRGGPTDTLVPLTASAARDAASACEAGGDQRGVTQAGPACDIGAAELSADLASTMVASRASVTAGSDITYSLRVTNTGPDAAPATTVDVMPPPGADLVLLAASAGTCSGTSCVVGQLDPGDSAAVTLVLRAPASGPITPVGTVSSAHPDADPADNVASATTEVLPAPATGGGGGGGGGGVTGDPVRDTTAPVLGSVKLVGSARTGKTVTLSSLLSEAATLSIDVDRLTAGRRVGTACRTGRRTGRACTVTKRLGTLKVAVAKGDAVRFRLAAKVAGRALKPGRHRLTLRATDAAGNRSRARTLTITVKR